MMIGDGQSPKVNHWEDLSIVVHLSISLIGFSINVHVGWFISNLFTITYLTKTQLTVCWWVS